MLIFCLGEDSRTGVFESKEFLEVKNGQRLVGDWEGIGSFADIRLSRKCDKFLRFQLQFSRTTCHVPVQEHSTLYFAEIKLQ